MGRAGEWLREERRRTLGDWVSVCLGCGHARRYFDEQEQEISATCPACGGEVRSRCPDCGARFSSAFAVDCEACGEPLRAATVLGVAIRRPGRGRRTAS
jgi:ribosomal protein S27E